MTTRDDEIGVAGEDLELELFEDSDHPVAAEPGPGKPEPGEPEAGGPSSDEEPGGAEAGAPREPDYSNLHVSEEVMRLAFELLDRKRRVETLLASATAERSNVPPQIFERVTGDYRRQLEEIAAEIGPVRHRLGEELKSIHEQEVRYRAQRETLAANITELKFRSQLGEFTEEDLGERIGELELVVGALDEQLQDFERTYSVVKELWGEDVEALVAAVRGAPKNASPMTSPRLSPPPPPPRRRGADEDRGQAQTIAPQVPITAQPTGEPRFNAVSSATVVLGRALLTRKRPDGGKAFVIDPNGLVLGRSISSDVVIQGATISRRHAIILFENGRFVIEDVSSGGGVIVNSVRVSKSILDDGDQIEVGSSLFEFRHG
jgi:hypothetical protein